MSARTTFAYTRWGAGAPIVVLHGFSGAGASMHAITDGLAKDYETITIDLPGHGKTQADDDRFALEPLVDDILALLHELGIARTHLIGYSLGGRIALGIATRAPQTIAALALIGSSPGIADSAERSARRAADDALAERIERDGIAAFAREWAAQPIFASQTTLDPALCAELDAARLANDRHGLATSLRMIGQGVQPPLWEALATIDAPVALLTGEFDAKYRGIAQAMAQRLPSAQVTVIDGAGHATHIERPLQTLAALRAFFAAHPTTQRKT